MPPVGAQEEASSTLARGREGGRPGVAVRPRVGGQHRRALAVNQADQYSSEAVVGVIALDGQLAGLVAVGRGENSRRRCR